MKLIQNKYLGFGLIALVALFLSFGSFFTAPAVAQGSTSIPQPKKLDDAKSKNCQKRPITTENCGILAIIAAITNVLSALVAIVIVIMITVGGIQYSMASGNPSAVSEARKKIFNAVIALVLFIFGFALLQYLIPGGIF